MEFGVIFLRIVYVWWGNGGFPSIRRQFSPRVVVSARRVLCVLFRVRCFSCLHMLGLRSDCFHLWRFQFLRRRVICLRRLLAKCCSLLVSLWSMRSRNSPYLQKLPVTAPHRSVSILFAISASGEIGRSGISHVSPSPSLFRAALRVGSFRFISRPGSFPFIWNFTPSYFPCMRFWNSLVVSDLRATRRVGKNAPPRRFYRGMRHVCLNWEIFSATEVHGSWQKLTEAKIGQKN